MPPQAPSSLWRVAPDHTLLHTKNTPAAIAGTGLVTASAAGRGAGLPRRKLRSQVTLCHEAAHGPVYDVEYDAAEAPGSASAWLGQDRAPCTTSAPGSANAAEPSWDAMD